MTVRPTIKFIVLAFIIGGLLTVIPLLWWATAEVKPFPFWIAFIPLIIFDFFATIQLIKRNLTSLRVDGDLLRYQTGFLSKTTRTMELVKVQNVAVDQSFPQRMVGLGDLSIETAGESSRITIHNIDRPQETADQILGLARELRRS